MSRSFEKYQNRRLKGSYFSVVLSMTIVLFVIGALATLQLKSKSIGDYFKEQVSISIYLKDEVSRGRINAFVKSLEPKPYTKEVNFVSKEDAAKIFS